MQAIVRSLAVVLFAAAGIASAHAACDGKTPCVTDTAIAYPDQTPSSTHGDMQHGSAQGSTHEITFNHNGGDSFWITAPIYATVVEIAPSGAQRFFPMPAGSGPHGIAFDKDSLLYVSLELAQQVVRLDPGSGKIVQTYTVSADPHGLGIGPDGKTVWFTGKTRNTVGKILPNGSAVNFHLATANALPIYIVPGPDGNMWFTELTGNKIGRVTPSGTITEFPIPTPNSRPIALVQDPSAPAIWFSEEAGNKVGRIDMKGKIVEFAVPKSQKNVILAALSFDSEENLWVQQYVDQNNPNPAGADHIVKIGKSILTAKPSDRLSFTAYEVPTRQTVMHRIIQGPDKNMWFTELKADRIGQVKLKTQAAMK